MKILRLAAAISFSRSIRRLLAILCALVWPLVLQSMQVQTPGTPDVSAAVSAPQGFRGIIDLDGPWRFEKGDDFEWALPGFDDSSWPTVNLSESLSNQGIDSYTGYAWYRLHLQPQQLSVFANLPANTSVQLYVASNSVGQLAVYVNGVEAGHTD